MNERFNIIGQKKFLKEEKSRPKCFYVTLQCWNVVNCGFLVIPTEQRNEEILFFGGEKYLFFQNKWRFYRHVVIKFEICIWWIRWAPIDRIDNHKCKVSCVLVFMGDTLCKLLSFVQIKKREKHLWVRVTLSKSSTPPWLLVTFFNCTNGTKLRKAFHVIH